MKHIEPTLTPNKVARFFNETLEMVQSDNLDEMSPEAFCEMVIEHQLGGYGGEFYRDYIQNVLAGKQQVSSKGKLTTKK